MARNILYELLAKFSADTSQFDKAVLGAEKAVLKFGKTVAAAAVAAAAAFGAMTIQQARVIDENRDMARSLNITYTSLQNMKLVARENGVELGALTGVLGIMQRNLFAAATATGDQRSALQVLGIDIRDIINLRPDEQFRILADAISKVENPTLRAGLSAELLGRNARRLAPLMAEYSKEIKNAADFNAKFGLSLSDIDADKVDKMNDAIARAKDAFNSFATVMAVKIAPAMARAADNFISFLEKLKKFADDAPKLLNKIAYAQMNFVNRMLGMRQISPDSLEALYGTKFDKDIFNFPKQEGTGGSADYDDLYGKEASKKAAEEAKERLEELRQLWYDNQREAEKFRTDTARVFSDFAVSVGKGENALDALKNKVLDVAGSVIDAMFQMSFGGSGGGGLAGTIAGALFGAFNIGGSSHTVNGMPVPPRKPFAKGGAFLNSSTMFPMSTGIGEAGEAGMEAIMPLVRGRGGKLGVSASGGGGPQVVNYNNFALGVQQTVRAEIMRLMPQINNSGITATQDAINRSLIKA